MANITNKEAIQRLKEFPVPKLYGNSPEESAFWHEHYVEPINMAISALEQQVDKNTDNEKKINNMDKETKLAYEGYRKWAEERLEYAKSKKKEIEEMSFASDEVKGYCDNILSIIINLLYKDMCKTLYSVNIEDGKLCTGEIKMVDYESIRSDILAFKTEISDEDDIDARQYYHLLNSLINGIVLALDKKYRDKKEE